MSRWLEDRREEEQEVWYECNEGCDEGMDGLRMRTEMMMMMNEMGMIEREVRVKYVVVPVALV